MPGGDRGIRVWSSETWGLEWTLRGHAKSTHGLVLSGRWLISSAAAAADGGAGVVDQDEGVRANGGGVSCRVESAHLPARYVLVNDGRQV